MCFRRIGCELAILAVVCVLSIFLFPVMRGPYSATHGPVTALQSVRATTKLRVAMIRPGRHLLRHKLTSSRSVPSWMALPGINFSPLLLAEHSTILRC